MNNIIKSFAFLFFGLSIIFANQTFAGSFEDDLKTASESVFDQAAKRAGLILNFKGLNSAKPLGMTGLTIGLEGTAGLVGLKEVTDPGSSDAIIPLTRFHIAKGLGFGFDAEFSAVHSSILKGLDLIDPDFMEVSLYGGGLKYSILNEDDEDYVSLAVRGTYTRGLFDTARLDVYGADVSVSKQLGLSFINLTPYMGLGLLHSRFELPLDFSEDIKAAATPWRLMGGIAATFLFAKIVAEVNYAPETTTASILTSFDL